MFIIAWILLGTTAGVVAHQFAGKRSSGLGFDAIVGIAGATVAGFAFNLLAGREGGVSSWGLLVSLLGAAIVLAGSSAFARRAPARPPPIKRRVRR